MSLVPIDPSPSAPLASPLPNKATNTRRPIIVGMAIILIAFGGFGTWAALAPLSSAAIAPGVVSVESNRKTIQHLEGGIVDEILVKEGSLAEAGQVLIRLQDTRAKAIFELLRGKHRTAAAKEARLIAERDRLKKIKFPASLLAVRGEPEVTEMLSGQRRFFKERRSSVNGQISILRQRIGQRGQQIGGLRAQVESKRQQIALIVEEVGGLQELYDKGYAPKTRLLALKRAKARLEGELAQTQARISQLNQAIGEDKLRIINVRNRFRTDVAGKLSDVQATLAELSDRLTAQGDVVKRLEVRAPLNGIVVGLKVHTKGGVILPGAPIMDIVPSEDRLIIEAQLEIQHIDVVHPGLIAQVRLSAYKRRTTPYIEGKVTHVSADRFVNPVSGRPYYQLRIEIDRESLAKLDDIKLYPGMSAEVMIETGRGKALQYLISPITDRFHRVFRED